ncbi:hypothetical protein ACFOY4_38920 [Actinomadura syzygii]|uniref:Tetratricopeptide repeat protein n=1 Tax=Actinomadura syzygii TaxID=1427538 RepID=A0A5D0UB97_9ACTN|nr:hypothetical protein [Actinomadura syzygii]TYC14349.1 hypothetical protein FXF65_15915 [Actinomadura syzygii]
MAAQDAGVVPAKAKALAQAAGVFVRAGALEHAERTARSIERPDVCSKVLLDLVRALADMGETGRAERIALSIADESAQAEALVSAARALSEIGEAERAAELVRAAEQVAPLCRRPAHAGMGGDGHLEGLLERTRFR